MTEVIGAPERIRTSDPQIRSLVLYPAELRALIASAGGGRCRRSAAGNGGFLRAQARGST